MKGGVADGSPEIHVDMISEVRNANWLNLMDEARKHARLVAMDGGTAIWSTFVDLHRMVTFTPLASSLAYSVV